MSNDLRNAIAEMNALPDIDSEDSERLRGFTRITTREIKAVGGVSAATSLEMIGYIRELEHALTTAHKEEREAAFREAIDVIKALPPNRWSGPLSVNHAVAALEAAATTEKGENDG